MDVSVNNLTFPMKHSLWHRSLVFLVGIGLFVKTPTAPSAEPSPKARPSEKRAKGGPQVQKPKITDTSKANIYADNWFELYINGNLVAVDSISFIPHNVVSVEILPEYPMTIAVMAKDNADANTGLEYDNSQIGDGGFILKFSDGTVTNASWKAKSFFQGPIDGDLKNPKTRHEAIPVNWFAVDFDDSTWENATEHSEEAVGPKEPFYQHDFAGAKWIWTKDLALDNTVIFRTKVASPPNGAPLPPKWPRGHIDESNR